VAEGPGKGRTVEVGPVQVAAVGEYTRVDMVGIPGARRARGRGRHQEDILPWGQYP
jgi:hypothetical protein